MTDPTPLDADEILCRRCESPAGVPCRTPGGARSRTVHMERRRDAAAGVIPQPKEPAGNRPTTRRKSPATAEGRAKGGRVAAQERARRRKEADAAVLAERERLEREALELEAANLARDAVRYDRDRQILRRHVLDAAATATERLLEGLDYLRRPRGYDADGKPVTVPVEVYRVKDGRRERVLEADGTPATKDEIDVVGWHSADQVERLAKIAASTLNSLRLEEGKPTGITGTAGDHSTAEILGAAGVDELLEWANRNLPRE